MSRSSNINSRFLFSHPAHFLALGFGSGLVPVAPGTFGTLAALPLWFLVANAAIYWQLLFIVAGFIAGIWFCSVASRNLGVHDHGGIVWDEFVGVWITLAFAPFSWLNLLIGFCLFRFFDVLKPWPIKWFDRKVHGGLGVMLDDVIAGLFAGICLYLVNVAII